MIPWLHRDISRVTPTSAMATDTCIYCRSSLHLLEASYHDDQLDRKAFKKRFGVSMGNSTKRGALNQAAVCPLCGWWKLIREVELYVDGSAGTHLRGGIGSLKELDLTMIDTPIAEVRSYLCAKYESRFGLHPRLFEHTVASVFEDFGYQSQITNYSGDDGIDVILHGASGETIGVQVKRYKNSINVEQIRSLAGALLIGGHTRGIFVTTSTYQSGAARTATLAEAKGKPIELVDANGFYEALGLAQLKHLEHIEALSAAFRDIPTEVLEIINKRY